MSDAAAVQDRAGYRFRKKPVVVEAAFYDGRIVGRRGDDGKVVMRTCPEWFPALVRVYEELPSEIRPGAAVLFQTSLFLGTLEGTMEARPGDWIVRGVAGEIYPCKPEIFERTYEPVMED